VHRIGFHDEAQGHHCHKKGQITPNFPDEPKEDTGYGSGSGRDTVVEVNMLGILDWGSNG